MNCTKKLLNFIPENFLEFEFFDIFFDFGKKLKSYSKFLVVSERLKPPGGPQGSPTQLVEGPFGWPFTRALGRGLGRGLGRAGEQI